MTSLLSGIRVLDLTSHIAGPYGTKMLADYGADVIKIERPGGGDPARRLGPFLGDEPHPERSGVFLHLNTCKRGVTLNLDTEMGRAILRELLTNSHAIIEDFQPGTMTHWGLGYDALSAERPHLVYTSISNFGQDGPYRDYRASEITVYGMGGAMFATGYPGREPVKMGANVVQTQAGQAAALATLIALYGGALRGHGDYIDFSLMESQAATQDRRTTQLITYQFIGAVNDRNRRPGWLGGGVRPCADGYFNVSTQERWIVPAFKMYGHPELLEDPRFATVEARARPEAHDELESYILPWYMSHTMQEAWREAQAYKLLSGPVYTPRDTVRDPYFRQRGYWETIAHPVAGSIEYPGRPFRVHDPVPAQPRRPAPMLGQHNEEILAGELGYSRQDLRRLRAAGVI